MSTCFRGRRVSRLALLSGMGLVLLGFLPGCGAVTVSAASEAAPAGTVLSFLGPYSSSHAYVVNDVVMFQGSSYVAIGGSTNVAPAGVAQSASVWVLLAQAGAAGAAGPAGMNGPAGAVGPVGPAGPAGIAGPVGAAGAAGVAGPAGAVGMVGPAGGLGATGPMGPAGPAGAPGVAGRDGAAGPAGPMGPAGATGPMGVAGAAGVAGPQGPTGPQGPAGAPGTASQSSGSFLAGRHFGVIGDSISSYLLGNAWQKVVVARTGMTLEIQDARPGRNFGQALECWGNPNPGSAPGTFHAGYAFGSTSGTCGELSVGLQDGVAFADSLATVDLEVIELGTNDVATPLGQLGDAVNAGTFYGNMRWVVEAYLTAKPTLRVVLVTPEYTSLQPTYAVQQDVNAMVAYGNSVGVPVINMYALGGVNALTLTTMTRDGIHPSDFAFSAIYGPVIAQQIQGFF